MMTYFIQKKKKKPSITTNNKNKSNAGFTLIEIVVVVALMVSVYAVIAPQVARMTGNNVNTVLGRLNGDVRAAYDMAVLHNKNYRLAFDFKDHKYWLEVLVQGKFLISDPDSEVSQFKEFGDQEQAEAAFEEWFSTYENLAGEEYKDPDSDEVIKPASPVLAAKSKLKDLELPKWEKVENLEWAVREIAPTLLWMGIQTENTSEYFSWETLGENKVVYINFFPSGYVERAFLHIGYDDGNGKPDNNEKPYTLITFPNQGISNLEVGALEFKLEEG